MGQPVLVAVPLPMPAQQDVGYEQGHILVRGHPYVAHGVSSKDSVLSLIPSEVDSVLCRHRIIPVSEEPCLGKLSFLFVASHHFKYMSHNILFKFLSFLLS